ncbi:MAG: carbohydrate ABC transporter permease [Lachnospiraceae bacterium]|jgi:ABC-type glycerol-3-phosphate transport system permease component|uniref:carbohydrate ABC transporter permease n=1 Tax=uncultured Acetatifactor sp. TaxID=1671927 RepID=UPI00260166A3|nr:carbohydrate ABC transporter permease [uncultured Acetatifactor sp.]MCI8789348.1 carbohydrate ABC transporter permease [Lachnospiraceae bacterium]
MTKWLKQIKATGGFRKAFVRYFTKGRSNRSVGGTVFLLVFIALFAVFALFPVAFMVGNAFKPMRELYRYPPTVVPQNPTGQNFKDLLEYASDSLVPFTRYLFNTGVLVIVGCLGQILLSAMAAFPLAKSQFRGKKLMSNMVVYALMFSGAVTAVPNYIIITRLGLMDSLWAVILPSFASTLGLYLLQNFMEMLPDSLIEAAKIDGASYFKTLTAIILPVVKPALMTVFIFTFQNLWGNTGGSYLYTENIKPLSYMLSRIAATGIARQGMASAASLLLFILPVLIFIITQSNVMETMATSGMKD